MATHIDHGGSRTPEILRGSILAQGAFVLALGVAAEAPAQEFVPLGNPLGGELGSIAADVSADGTIVVGYSFGGSTFEAFRWTEGVMVGLGDLDGGLFQSLAFGVSADGAVVVGQGTSGSGLEAFRWTQEGGMVGLGDLDGGDFWSRAMAASADGAVVVGGHHRVWHRRRIPRSFPLEHGRRHGRPRRSGRWRLLQ